VLPSEQAQLTFLEVHRRPLLRAMSLRACWAASVAPSAVGSLMPKTPATSGCAVSMSVVMVNASARPLSPLCSATIAICG
jgi:hypothetical protein